MEKEKKEARVLFQDGRDFAAGLLNAIDAGIAGEEMRAQDRALDREVKEKTEKVAELEKKKDALQHETEDWQKKVNEKRNEYERLDTDYQALRKMVNG